MRSVRDELRQVVGSFDPQSREYWGRVADLVARRVPPEMAGHARLGVGAVGAAVGFFFREVAAIVPAVLEARRVRAAIDRERDRGGLPEEFARYRALPKDGLKDALKIEVARREQFTRKAQAYLMAVTLGTSFTIGVIGILAKAPSLPPGPVVGFKVVLVGLVLSLFMSAVAALWVIAPSEAYDLFMQERTAPTGDAEADDRDEKDRIIRLVLFNQAYSLVSAAYLSASYAGMRNGVWLVVAVLVAAILLA